MFILMNQTDTLARLNKEKDYEDRLAENLSNYFLNSLDSIPDITAEQREKTKDNLMIIMQESNKHAKWFDLLIQMVVENGEDNY